MCVGGGGGSGNIGSRPHSAPDDLDHRATLGNVLETARSALCGFSEPVATTLN